MNGVQIALNDLATAQVFATFFFHVLNLFMCCIHFKQNITVAMQRLGDVFSQYNSQNFPLEHSDTEFPAVVDKFQRTVNEVC